MDELKQILKEREKHIELTDSSVVFKEFDPKVGGFQEISREERNLKQERADHAARVIEQKKKEEE